MRILFLIDDFYLPEIHAGTALNTHHLALRLKARGHSVAVAARADTRVQLAVRRNLGYPVYFGRKLGRMLELLPHSARFDVQVHQNRGLWTQLAPFELGDGHLPVFYEHTLLEKARLPPPQIRSRALCLASSALLARHLRTFHGIGSIVMPPIFGVDRFGALPRTPTHVTMVSLQPSKGCDIAVRLARKRPDVPFVLVESWNGDRSEAEALKRSIEDLPNVRVVPNQPDLSSILAGTRLLLMPSRVAESWGRIATECQLLGIPVLASDRGNLPDTIGPGGVTLDPDDELEAWEAAFDRLWTRPRELDRLGKAAQAHAQGLMRDLDAALLRFELLLQAAVPLQWPRDGVIGAKLRATPVKAEGTRTIEGRRAHQHRLAALSPPEIHSLARELAPEPRQTTAKAIAEVTGLSLRPDGLALARQHAIQCERAVLADQQALEAPDRKPEIVFTGRAHLDRALKVGRGVVLLVSPTAFGGHVLRMALRGERIGFAALPRRALPEAAERHSQAAIRARFEALFARQPAAGRQHDGADVTAVVLAALRRNEVVIADPFDCGGEEIAEQPFLNGKLRVSVLPMRIAQLAGAALMMASGIALPEDGFEVRFSSPTVLAADGPAAGLFRVVAARFAAHVAQDMIRFPTQWLGWPWLEEETKPRKTTRRRRAEAPAASS